VKNGLFGVIAVLIIGVFIFNYSKEKTEETAANVEKEEVIKTEDSKVEQEPVEEVTVSWEDKVKEIAASTGTETEKFDQVSSFAMNYKSSKEEITEFEEFIIKEYKEGRYISDLKNNEYMLGNIFKSQVVEQSYQEGEPMKDFAFDFLQNSKYTYRGVDTATSESTLSNQEQMDKKLSEMGK
jgi:hypothetical protein